jgi:hypothetical protein
MDANNLDVIMFALRHMARSTPKGRNDATSAMMLLGCTCKTFNAKVKAQRSQEERLSEFGEFEYYERVNRAVLWNTGGLYDPAKDWKAVEAHAGSGAPKWRFVRECVRLGARPAKVAEMCNRIGAIDRWTSAKDRFALSLALVQSSYVSTADIKIALYDKFDALRPLPRPESIADDSENVDWHVVRKHVRQVLRTYSGFYPELHQWHSDCLEVVRARIDKIQRYKTARWDAFCKDRKAQAELFRYIDIRKALNDR